MYVKTRIMLGQVVDQRLRCRTVYHGGRRSKVADCHRGGWFGTCFQFPNRFLQRKKDSCSLSMTETVFLTEHFQERLRRRLIQWVFDLAGRFFGSLLLRQEGPFCIHLRISCRWIFFKIVLTIRMFICDFFLWNFFLWNFISLLN